MKKVIASLLMLSLSACQVPGLIKTSGPLTRQEYGKKFSELFTNYTKTSLKGSNIGTMVMAGMSGSPSSLPAAQSVLMPVPLAGSPSRPPSSPTSPQPPSRASLGMTMPTALLTTMMQGVLKANTEMEASLSLLIPPPELAAKHALLLSYFTESGDLMEAMLTELKTFGPSLTPAQNETMNIKFKDRIAKIKAIQPEVMNTLYAFRIEAYRAERLSLQQGPALDLASYKTRLLALTKGLPASPLGALTPGMGASTDAQGQSTGSSSMEQLPARFAALKVEMAKALVALGQLHPPPELEEAHTVMYATTRLNIRVLERLVGLVAANPEAIGNNPFALLGSLFSDEELLSVMMEISIMMPKATEAQLKLRATR